MKKNNKKNSKKNMKKRMKFVMTLILIYIILVIIGVAFVLFNNKNKNDKNTDASNVDNVNQIDNVDDTDNINQVDTEQIPEGTNNMEVTENVEIIGEKKENTSSKFLEEKTFEGIKFSNISFIAEKGITKFYADIENTTNETYPTKEIAIVLCNTDGNELEKIVGTIYQLEPKESGVFEAYIAMDASNAYDFKIESNN